VGRYSSRLVHSPDRTVVYLNRFEDGEELHSRNRDWLVTREGLEVVTRPEALVNVVARLTTG